MFPSLSILTQIQNLPINLVHAALMPVFAQLQPTAHSKSEKEPQQKIQHKEVSLADYCITPGPKQFKRCNDIIRSLSSTDNLGSIPRVFQALDEAFFNGRVGKVASAVGVRSKTPYTAGVGGYSFRDSEGLVIRLPTWDGKTTTLRDDLNILFREMASIDFYVVNTCRCEDCLRSNSVKVCEFVEYLTRLDKLANLHLEGFQKQWNIREDSDFEISKKAMEKADQVRKMEQAAQTLEDPVAIEYERCIERLKEATQTSEALASLVAELEHQADYFEKLYMGVLKSTEIVEKLGRRKSVI